jgi:hypothetical protein
MPTGESKMKRPLTDKDLLELRQKGFIAAEETAYWMGDKLIAENLISQQRRVLDSIPTMLFESQRRVLRG